MPKIKHQPFFVQSLMAGCVVFAVALALMFYAISLEQKRLENDLREDISQHAVDMASQVQTAINGDVFLANGLIAYIAAHPTDFDDRIDLALAALHKLSPHLRNVGVAPGNRISHIYPLKGNEAALGLYYPDIPGQWAAVRKAIETHTTVLAGPIPLKQGGVGLISRTPVFLQDGSYWGIVSLVIDTQKLFHDVFTSQRREGTLFAIRGRNGQGADGDVIYGDSAMFDRDSFKTNISIPGGIWQLAAEPEDGWTRNQNHLIFGQFFAFFIAFLLSFAAFMLQNQRYRTISSEQRLRTFLDNTHDGVIVMDGHGKIQEFNPAAETMFGYSAHEMLASPIDALFTDTQKTFKNIIHKGNALREYKNSQRIRVRHKDGSKFTIESTIAIARIKGQIHYVAVMRDISEQLKLEAKLRDLANTDSLTGALNRRAFLETTAKQFKLAKRNGHPMTVLMMDLDHFKQINDTYGHHMGDLILIHAVDTIQSCLRETDTFGRFGGEEFIAVLPGTNQLQAIEVMERILHTIRSQDAEIEDGSTVALTMSIGASEQLADDRDINATIQRADQALYKAKQAGRDRYVVHQEPPQ